MAGVFIWSLSALWENQSGTQDTRRLRPIYSNGCPSGHKSGNACTSACRTLNSHEVNDLRGRLQHLSFCFSSVTSPPPYSQEAIAFNGLISIRLPVIPAGRVDDRNAKGSGDVAVRFDSIQSPCYLRVLRLEKKVLSSSRINVCRSHCIRCLEPARTTSLGLQGNQLKSIRQEKSSVIEKSLFIYPVITEIESY